MECMALLSRAVAERLGIIGGGAIALGIARVAAEHGDVVMWVRSDDQGRTVETVNFIDVVSLLSQLGLDMTPRVGAASA